MNYKDIRGEGAKEICRELGIAEKYKGSYLAEVRENDGSFSISATRLPK